MRHGSEVLRIVESGGNEGEENSDFLVRCGRYFEELGEDFDAFRSVGILKRRKM